MSNDQESPTLTEAIADVVMLNDEANQITLAIIGTSAAFQGNREAILHATWEKPNAWNRVELF